MVIILPLSIIKTALLTSIIISLSLGAFSQPLSAQQTQTGTVQQRQNVFAIVPLVNTSQQGQSANLGLHLSESLTTRLSQARQFTFIERDQIQSVIKELGLAQSDLANQQAQAPRLGQLLGAQYLIVGSYHVNAQDLSIRLRVVETETGKIQSGGAFELSGKLAAQDALLTQLAARLSQYLQTELVASNPALEAAYRKGLMALLNQQSQTAEAIFKAQLAQDPGFAKGYLGLAQVSAAKARQSKNEQDWKETLAWTREALQRQPSLTEAIVLSADALTALKQNEAAVKTLNDALQQFPGRSELVIARLQQQRPQLTHTNLKATALEYGADLQDPVIQRFLGLELANKGIGLVQPDFSEAIVYLKQAQQSLQNDDEVALALVLAYWGSDQPEQAEVYLKQLQPIASADSTLSLRLANFGRMLALTYTEQNKLAAAERMLSDSVELLESRLQQDPNATKLRVELAEIRILQSQPQLAEALLLQALESDAQNPRNYLSISELFKKTGNLAAQERVLKQGLALATTPEHKSMYNFLANDLVYLYRTSNRAPQATALLQTMRPAHPLYAEAQLQLANIALMAQNWPEMLDYYQKAFADKPDLKNDPDHQLGYRKAYLHVALAKQPQQGALWNDLGQIALAEEDLLLAQQYLETALKFSPEQAVIYYNLGLAYLAQDMHEAARTAFQEALKRKADYPKALYNLALLAHQQKEPRLALQYINQALAQQPDYPEAIGLKDQIIRPF